MHTILRSTVACSLLAAAGCPGLAKEAPRPPTYDDECNASHQFYYELAAETQDMAASGVIPVDPVEALKVAEQEIADNGIDIQPKAEGIEDWEKFNTTFPDTIYTSKTYPDMSDAGKAGILWHELVHVREYDRHGVELFFTIYAFAEGRWALEVQAYRESFRVRRLWGEDEARIQEAMILTAESLYDGYSLGNEETNLGMPRSCALSKAVETWMLDSR